jgi:hypothetical protein
MERWIQSEKHLPLRSGMSAKSWASVPLVKILLPAAIGVVQKLQNTWNNCRNTTSNLQVHLVYLKSILGRHHFLFTTSDQSQAGLQSCTKHLQQSTEGPCTWPRRGLSFKVLFKLIRAFFNALKIQDSFIELYYWLYGSRVLLLWTCTKFYRPSMIL